MTLSVILPNFNHSHHLPLALESIFSQSLLPDEVLIIDDASTDDSVSVIKTWQNKHPQIRLLQNTVNQGPVPTINRGIQEAQSELLAFCSADDFVLPGFFKKASEFLHTHPEIGMCTGKTCHFHDHTPHLLLPDWMPFGNATQILTKDMLPQVFKKTTFFIHTNCAIHRKKHLIQFGGLNPKLKSLGDWYLNCLVALHYGVGYIPSYFGAFRLTETSYSQKLKSSEHQDGMFHSLLQDIKERNLEHLFKDVGLLSHGGIRLVLFLAKQKEYRAFFPRAFLKKCHFHFNKLFKSRQPLP
ncbi:MAG: glycosyltransferase family 2 protein, partial [Chlamydiia bacterium]|nr:glycosyltransferase family 2 protein [Chlamydiia bacterium]